MRNNNYKVGLDVGSTTAKIVVIDGRDKIIYSRYERHNARVGQLVSSYLDEIVHQFGDLEVNLCVTGSVGMSTAEQLQAEFIQEVVAATVFAKARYPEAKALIDIGGEDAKVVFFNGRNTELRMNGNCAGGTGAFLDQMSVLMGIDNNTMSNLAMQAERIYPMAARCGVFAKTDIQNLMARNLPESDIAVSIFHSIAVQTVTTLSHGCDFQPPILLCGGPLTFLPALRKAFADYLKLDEGDFIVIPESNLIPALGCAIRGKGSTVKLSELRKRLDTQKELAWHSDLRPLFKNEIEHQKWLERKSAFATEIHPLRKGSMQVVLGIDSGSTTTKIIALDMENSDIVFSFYTLNLGNPIKAVREGLERLRSEAAMMNCDLKIAGACSTGYGEELIKAAFNLDEGIIETIAHYRAAESLMPDVSFILDIGGQDMKAIFVENGAVVRMELNEACSSGCGTFIQTFANNLNYKVQDFAKIACTAPAPCDLGTRCTVFMNSKVKQVLREGATIADISAGLSYSVVKNCLYKVLKLRGNDSLGESIVVQGGTMRNDSVVRAFELLTGTEVARNNMPEMMGAYGCALYLKGKLDAKAATGARTLDQLLAGAEYETRMLQCHGCENRCFVSMYQFQGGRKFYSGNKCERVFNNKGTDAVKGENIYAYKYQRLFREPAVKPREGSRRIGIPRVLNMYEDYPFWSTLLRQAGFDTVLSSESTFVRYEGALGSVMSDNICFPAKLVHSHIHELESLGVERILMPYVVYEHNEDARTLNSYNCPIVSAYSDVVRSAMNPKVPVDSPVINFSNQKLLVRQIEKYLHGLGVSRRRAQEAFRAALEAQRSYIRDIKAENTVILRKSREQGQLTILLAGRPYHTDPLIQHKLSEMVASLGVNVISDDIVRGDDSVDSGETYLVKQWAYMNRIIKAGQWAAEQEDDLHFVQMTSFGCGPDAFIQDEIRDILKRHGKPFTLLKIDDVSNIGSLKLRVRSLIESLKAKSDDYHHRTQQLETTRVFRQADTRRKILAPYMTAYLTPLLSPLLDLMGYDVEVLPMSDDESAQLGLTYANNEICYPATLIVGDIVKALKSGKYDLNNTAVVMTQTGGQCRATNYAGLIKRAMIANGFNEVPLITLGVATNAEGGNEQEGFSVPWTKFANIITTAILYGDTISKMYHATVVRERKPGVAALLRDKFMQEADPLIRRNDASGLLALIGNAAAEFDAVCVDKETRKVGIVGEIFLKFNPFSHQFLADKIISRGIEVVPPLLSPFFLQEFVNVIAQKHMGLSCSRVPDFVVKGIYGLILRREKKINRIAARFRYFRPFTNIFDEARAVNGTVSLAAQFGEGWLLPADIISLVHDGVNNIVSLQPFGCIANHVVSKGIEKRLHRDYPQLNLVSLDFDSGVSAVNVTNRLLLFLDSIAV
ncbi:acyl-CoA dehydratase activase-related protein [Prevotella sp. KH2C16]|uniref:acyl-CoA dehydratase activase-related protein n=1 Tax=Prevotella sp. KH2C16 TaxID=1855325 RepID=UPI0008E1EB47|nr:acyl-CoA dehydratase activase-related protein [Prevotella sp. KH2C16]SFG16357.1 CoA-substrate-specific enzyme activase, putative [Prevotella sp. KH2C16]